MDRAPERTVLAVGLLGGLLFAFVSPPFQVADEPVHLRRAYQIATGATLVRRADGGVGAYLPASFEELFPLCLAGMPFHPLRRLPEGILQAARRIPLAPARKVFVPLSWLTPYAPVPYLPQAAAAVAGRWLELPPLAILYLARLCNLAACLAVVWAAVRIAPFYKWAFAFLALTPMAMFLRSSASPDALTTDAPLLLASVICALALGRQVGTTPSGAGAVATPNAVATPGRIACLLGTAAVVATCKGGYFLLNLLVLLIPSHRLGSRRRWAMVMGGVLLITAAGLANSLWTARSYFSHFQRDPSVQPFLQARGVAAHPLRFLGLVASDYALHLPSYVAGFVGNFGWLDTPLPIFVVVAYGSLLLALAATGGDARIDLPPRGRLLVAAVVVMGLLFISTSQYLGWTPVGEQTIEGPQGRYFLPLAPAGALLLYNRRWPRLLAAASPPWLDAAAMAGVSAAFTVVALLRIWTRYHGW